MPRFTNTVRKNNKRNFGKPKRKQLNYKKSEYMTQKYDDIDREHRVVLSHMASDEHKHWNINDFRAIPSFGNDGNKISAILTYLSQRTYIKKTNQGWRLWHLATNCQ